MKFKRTLSLFMMGVMLSSSLPYNAFAEDAIINSNGSLEDVTTSGSSIFIVSNDIDIEFNVTGKWNGGFNGEITITNTSDSKIENWQIEMTFPQEITNIWNARIDSVDNGVYNIKNAGGNNNVDIPVGGSVTFGFTGTYTDDIVAPTNVKLITGKQNASDEEYSIDYQLMSDWGSGFTAQIVITNNTDKPMEAWHLEFDYAGEISNIWNGVIEKSENGRYYISNADYNSVISANSNITIGFNGIPDTEHTEPSDFKLYYFGNNDGASTHTETEEENIMAEVDTDGDGVFDYIEEYFGSDINLEDTDGDGLSDYIEIFVIGTDPTMIDTDENGIDDGYEDADQDGLMNIEEVNFGTSLVSTDTDSDGLSDFDEVKKYHTNPTIADTDNDGLEDGDDILLGFDPNKYDTDGNGIKDGDEKIEQTLHQKIDCEELPGITDLDVTLSVSGNINNVVTAKNMYNINTLSSGLVGITGAPIDLNSSQEFDYAEISFIYDEKYLDIPPEQLCILWYDEKNQFYEVMQTTLDKQNHCIKMNTTHFSEYTVVDKDKWFAAWEDDFNKKYKDGSLIEKNKIWQGKIVTADQLVSIYKYTYGLPMELNNILPYCENGDVYCRIGKFFMTLKNGDTVEYDCLFMAYNEFSSAVFFTSGDGEMCCCPPYYKATVAYNSSYNTKLFDYPEEILNTDTVNLPPAKDVVAGSCKYEFGEKYFLPSGQVDTTDKDGDDLYDIYESTGMRIANGNVIFSDSEDDKNPKTNKSIGYDSDNDGIKDGDEIERYDSEKGYFILKTNPDCPDSDFDGIEDIYDRTPFNNGFLCKFIDRYTSGFAPLEFNMDYRWFFGDNESYNRGLCTLSSIMAMLMYNNPNTPTQYRSDSIESTIEITSPYDYDFEYLSEKKDIESLMKYLGFKNVDTYPLDEINEYSDIHVSEVGLGYREYSYNQTKKKVLAVFVRGTNSSYKEWASNFYIGNLNNPELSWVNKDNHAGFDITAKRVEKVITDYIENNGLNEDDITYWITGHSRGAAIANIIGADFEKQEKECFTYTFATPNTTRLVKEAHNYKTIFNIINEDDFVPHLPVKSWNYSRYGRSTVDVGIQGVYEKQWENFTGLYDYSSWKENLGNLDILFSIIVDGDPRTELYSFSGDRDQQIALKDMVWVRPELSDYTQLSVMDGRIDTCPAYIMNYFALVSAFPEKYNSIATPLPAKYKPLQGMFIIMIPLITHPHYPKSYYILSQHIKDSDFR